MGTMTKDANGKACRIANGKIKKCTCVPACGGCATPPETVYLNFSGVQKAGCCGPSLSRYAQWYSGNLGSYTLPFYTAANGNCQYRADISAELVFKGALGDTTCTDPGAITLHSYLYAEWYQAGGLQRVHVWNDTLIYMALANWNAALFNGYDPSPSLGECLSDVVVTNDITSACTNLALGYNGSVTVSSNPFP